MMKIAAVLLVVLITWVVAGCEGAGTPAASAGPASGGKVLGDTGVRVSGTVEAGGGVRNH